LVGFIVSKYDYKYVKPLLLYRMTSYKKSKEEFSRDVYKAFQSIGVTSDMIHWRRNCFLLDGTVYTTGLKLLGFSHNIFIVGSQVEGSTTIGMRSDTDHLFLHDNVQVVLKLGAWQAGKNNLLAFQDETTPPQFYKLCILQPTPDGRQECMRGQVNDSYVVEQGRVLCSHRIVDKIVNDVFKGMGSDRVVKHGPSISNSDEYDFVCALPCNDLPEECESFFTRSRPGHWPKSETLEYARQCPVFFIPQGHPHSLFNELQWRVSTSLTERKLIFNFSEEQMLVFVLLKMLRKEYCKPKFGDDFSTFHIKTAMMFTIESHPQEIWRIDNIVECASYCIDILIQYAQDNVFPHFTMSGVNLFDGKLSEPDIKELETFLINLNKNIVEYISNLEMDSFGLKVLLGVHDEESKLTHEMEIRMMIRAEVRSALCDMVKMIYFQIITMHVVKAECSLSDHITYLAGLQSNGERWQREAADLFLPFLYGTLASINASHCITTNLPVTQDIIDLYKPSLECDLMSGKLKYASMLYCSGQFEQAADMLIHCEGLLGPDVVHDCQCQQKYNFQSDTCFRKYLYTSIVELLKTSSTSCVWFSEHELQCVPKHLRCEMYRTQTQNDKNKRNVLYAWMDMVVIDCVTFLYYLQYLVYRQKGNLPMRLLAMFNLMDYANKLVNTEVHKRRAHCVMVEYLIKEASFHTDTTFHVLAHCWELENRPDVAWQLYQVSMNTYRTNNIALVHLIRLFIKYFL